MSVRRNKQQSVMGLKLASLGIRYRRHHNKDGRGMINNRKHRFDMPYIEKFGQKFIKAYGCKGQKTVNESGNSLCC